MAVTADYQYDLNGLTFGVGTTMPTTGSKISVQEIEGLDAPEVTVLASDRSNQHGAFVSAKYRKARTVSLVGRCYTSAANFAADKYTLVKTFQPQDPAIAFTFRLTGYGNQFLNVNPVACRFAVQNTATAVGWIDFLATLVAGDPRIYSSTLQTVTVAASGSNTATNGGTEVAPTSITFNGPLTNPLLTNTTTGATFGLTTTIASGHSVVVDSLAATVVLDGTTSQYSTITPSAKTFIELAVGANSLSLTQSAGTGNAAVAFRDTFM
jgi:hypothetical protein